MRVREGVCYARASRTCGIQAAVNPEVTSSNGRTFLALLTTTGSALVHALTNARDACVDSEVLSGKATSGLFCPAFFLSFFFVFRRKKKIEKRKDEEITKMSYRNERPPKNGADESLPQLPYPTACRPLRVYLRKNIYFLYEKYSIGSTLSRSRVAGTSWRFLIWRF